MKNIKVILKRIINLFFYCKEGHYFNIFSGLIILTLTFQNYSLLSICKIVMTISYIKLAQNHDKLIQIKNY